MITLLVVLVLVLLLAVVGLAVLILRGGAVRVVGSREAEGEGGAGGEGGAAVVGVLSEGLAWVHRSLGQLGDSLAQHQADLRERHGALDARLGEAVDAHLALAAETRGLKDVLAHPGARGNWGERAVEDLFRRAGLCEGISYRRQATLEGGGRPDFTVLLPRDRVLHVDAKFPLDNYARALDTSGADARRFGDDFVRDVRRRVRELSRRDYTDAATTVGYVVLFMPNEGVLSFAAERDPGLVDAALAQRVLLCSPFTLFGVLAVIRQATEVFELGRRSDEVLQRLVALRAEWERYASTVDQLGRQLTTLNRTFEELHGARRRQLGKRFDTFSALVPPSGVEGPGADGQRPDGP